MANPEVFRAARNNAHLYERICAAHHCPVSVDENLLRCLSTPPRFYSEAVTLQPEAVHHLGEIAGGFKDSFCEWQPEWGTRTMLFEAEWIWLEPGLLQDSPTGWHKVETNEELQAWELAWGAGDAETEQHPRQFPESLLGLPDIWFYGFLEDGVVIAGFIINTFEGVVGVSNAFSEVSRGPWLWESIVQVCGASYAGQPVTGYERGSDLNAARAAGFSAIGPLRVWVRQIQLLWIAVA